MPTPYTYALHAQRCTEAAQYRAILVQWVQARSGPVTHCGRIVECWTTNDGVDLWKLETVSPRKAIISVRVNRTTQCSGLDGRCVCAGEPGLSLAAPCAPGAAAEAGNGGGFGSPHPAVLAVREAGCFCQAGVVAPPDSLNFEKTAF